MKIKEYLEMGEKKLGKQILLAKYLDTRDSTIRLVKLGKMGLPVHNCIQLAKLIEVDPLKVIAASNLVTEKKEDRRKIFEACLNTISMAAIGAALLLGNNQAEAKPFNITFSKDQNIHY